ncbi:MAG: DUF3450 domain-containing protein [Phycisphaeraceae bacterium]|nr:DUF3450 domain-containing protein [Phycisphaeraceae bacterium]
MRYFKAPSLYGLVILLPAVFFATNQATAQDAPQPDEAAIDEARLMLERWGEVRRAIAREKSDWVLAKQVLEDRIDLLKRNIDAIHEETKAQEQKLWGFDEKVAILEKKNVKLKKTAEELSELVERMETQAIALIKGAPQPLIEGVKPLAVQLPGYTKNNDAEQALDEGAEATVAEQEGEATEDAEAAPPLARRVENVVGVLYLFNKYAGKLDQTSELVARPDGSSLSVDAIYLGTGYGFYVDDSDQVAAAGWSSPTGWMWTETQAAPERVRQVIQVFNKDQPAAFVGLPVEVKE